MARVGGRYAVQGHSRSLILVPIENAYCDFPVNKTNLYSISHRFPVIAQYAWIIAFVKRVPLVNALVISNVCEYRHKSYITGN